MHERFFDPTIWMRSAQIARERPRYVKVQPSCSDETSVLQSGSSRLRMTVSVQLATKKTVGQSTVFKALVNATARQSAFLVGTPVTKGISPTEWKSFGVNVAHASKKVVRRKFGTNWNWEGTHPVLSNITGGSASAVFLVEAACFGVAEIIRARSLIVTRSWRARGTNSTRIAHAWIRSIFECANWETAGALFIDNNQPKA